MLRTFLLTAALALLAAACTTTDPPEATPPPEATSPATPATPRATSTPEPTPSPVPTPEVTWFEDGLPLGIEGPLIVLHDGDWLRAITVDGRLVNSIEVGRWLTRLSGARVSVAAAEGVHLIRIDGQRSDLSTQHALVTSYLESERGDAAWVEVAQTPGRFRRARPADYTVVARSSDSVDELRVPYPEFRFVAGSSPIIAFWHGEQVVVGSLNDSEVPPQFALLALDGSTQLLAPPAHPVFSVDRSTWARPVEQYDCLDLGAARYVITPLTGGDERVVSSNSRVVRVIAIGPGGDELIYSEREPGANPNDCTYSTAPERPIHVRSDGSELQIGSQREVAERWGLLPPFEVECVDLTYRFCPAVHDIGVGQFGRVVYSPNTADIIYLGTTDLPPP